MRKQKEVVLGGCAVDRNVELNTERQSERRSTECKHEPVGGCRHRASNWTRRSARCSRPG